MGQNPCCAYIGPEGAGHYVKMVHNGIEYGDMQLICEAYYLMKQLLHLSPDQIADYFRRWNLGELSSYLIEISAHILTVPDPETGTPLVDRILREAGSKGCRVRPFNWSELDEIFELRLMMEVSFAPQATVAVQNTPQLQNRFEDNLQKNMELVQHYDTAEEYFETYEIDQQFHELIVLASGNRTAIRVYKNLNSHAYATYLFGKQPRIQTINGILEHRAIYESMKAGNVDQVRHLLNSHLENARKKISLSLKLQQNGGQP